MAPLASNKPESENFRTTKGVLAVEAATVLVVDDDAAIRRLICQRLTEQGFVAMEAGAGEIAVALTEDSQIDIVLLDIIMPGMDGFAVLRKLRERRSMSTFPIIMLTAKDKSGEVVEALQLGANDYITKPVDFDLLCKRINVHLSLRTGKNKEIGGYRIINRIGAGGMGVVFSATALTTGAKVAIKILPRSLTVDEAFVQRFLREAALAARVNHPNVVMVHEAGRDDETYFIAMEFVDGQNLAEVCEGRPIAWQKALTIARQLVDGIEALKTAGIVHRDLKPENVLVTTEGVAKITDFGIARETRSAVRMTEVGVGIGSVIYASPEQIRGQGDYKSDIYSLGCTLYFMITGRDPFPEDESLEEILRRKESWRPKIVPYPSHIPKPIRTVISRMIAPKPSRRSRSCQALRTDIDELLGADTARREEQRRGFAKVGVAIAVLVAALVLWSLWRYG